MKLQGAQQTDRLEHLRDVHLQAALQLDEEPADLWVDLPILWPAVTQTLITDLMEYHEQRTNCMSDFKDID